MTMSPVAFHAAASADEARSKRIVLYHRSSTVQDCTLGCRSIGPPGSAVSVCVEINLLRSIKRAGRESRCSDHHKQQSK